MRSKLPLLASCLAASLCARPAAAQNSHNLWRVVHGLCVSDRRLTGLPVPCLEVDLKRGFAVLRDPRRPFHLLVVPTRRISGIGSPKLLEPGAPNYWQAAWEQRGRLTRDGQPVPRDAVAMAVNSVYGRSQGQLHIHIACVRTDVHRALLADAQRFDEQWSDWPGPVNRRYRVRLVKGETLAAVDPFRLLAEDEAAAADMSRQTLIVVGAHLADGPGFFLLSDQADRSRHDSGHGEELLDEQGCAVAKASPTPP
jgi:CDP-diacylglycerol pyrophosphatase